MSRFSKTDLAAAVASHTAIPAAEAGRIIDATFALLADQLGRGEASDVTLIGFGRFRAKAVPARPGVHPGTGEAITLPAGRKISFHAAPALRRRGAAAAN